MMKLESIVVGKGTPYPLRGLLTLPDDVAKPVPALVFVHGSGASNMDEKVGELTPFKDLAEGLAAHGIVTVLIVFLLKLATADKALKTVITVTVSARTALITALVFTSSVKTASLPV